MDNPYAPPAARRRNDSPPAKNSFQRELNRKLQDRKSKGLVTSVDDDDSGAELSDEGSFKFLENI